jgi:stage V sporulation protein SpoVS
VKFTKKFFLYSVAIVFLHNTQSLYGSQFNKDIKPSSSTTKPTHINSVIVSDLTSYGTVTLQNINTPKALNNKTPLHYAVDYINPIAVKILVEHGANKNALDNDNRTALNIILRDVFYEGHNPEVRQRARTCATILAPGEQIPNPDYATLYAEFVNYWGEDNCRIEEYKRELAQQAASKK